MTTTLQPRLLRNHPSSLIKSRLDERRVGASEKAIFGFHRAPVAANAPVWSFQAKPAEDFFSEMWSPGLLDRLQAPLSRYHE